MGFLFVVEWVGSAVRRVALPKAAPAEETPEPAQPAVEEKSRAEGRSILWRKDHLKSDGVSSVFQQKPGGIVVNSINLTAAGS
jgi:hypothetical protein